MTIFPYVGCDKFSKNKNRIVDTGPTIVSIEKMSNPTSVTIILSTILLILWYSYQNRSRGSKSKKTPNQTDDGVDTKTHQEDCMPYTKDDIYDKAYDRMSVITIDNDANESFLFLIANATTKTFKIYRFSTPRVGSVGNDDDTFIKIHFSDPIPSITLKKSDPVLRGVNSYKQISDNFKVIVESFGSVEKIRLNGRKIDQEVGDKLVFTLTPNGFEIKSK